MVAAAFIGPGTVTTATLAGARYGGQLLWALLFGTLATMALQEMAARLGLVTGRGLGEAVRRRFPRPGPRAVAVGLVVAAVAGGNAAYETGNLLGGALGLSGAVGGSPRLWAGLMGAVAGGLLLRGSYRTLERVMVLLVGLMSVAFLATAVAVVGRVDGLLHGLLVPALPDPGALLVAVGLIGTTVVPYNLFLHAAAVQERWSGVADLPQARLDLALSIGVGGVVGMAILITAAGTLHGGGAVESAADMARALEPLLGRWAGAFFALGLFAAGLTSSITAPLAAAWATAGALAWPRDLADGRVRAVWGSVLGAGIVLALTGVRPVSAILFAQAANGILLPAVAVFLLLAVNDRRWMGPRVNGVAANVAGVVVVGVAGLLGVRILARLVGLL
jgi:NRAMP (natural resistance-associated macrophage protein)-like metal ion transporter